MMGDAQSNPSLKYTLICDQRKHSRNSESVAGLTFERENDFKRILNETL